MVEEVKVFSYSMKYLNQSTYLELRMNPVSEQTTPKTPLLTPKYKVGIESRRYKMDAQRLRNNKTSFKEAHFWKSILIFLHQV